MDGWMDGWMDAWMHGCMDAWLDGWLDGWTDGRTDGWMVPWAQRSIGCLVVCVGPERLLGNNCLHQNTRMELRLRSSKHSDGPQEIASLQVRFLGILAFYAAVQKHGRSLVLFPRIRD